MSILVYEFMHWSTVFIDDPSSLEAEEEIVLTQTPEISVCLSYAMMGQPFISTLELRMFSGSMYSTHYEADFFLGISARINFGAESNESIRYTLSSLELVLYYSFRICSHYRVP
jgi:hypothetical protein